MAVAALRAQPAVVPVAAGRILPGPAFLDGLYGPERHPDGYEYRWTTGALLVQLRGAFFAAPVYLAEVRLRADTPAPPPLRLLAGGRPVAETTPETRFRTYRVLLGPGSGEGAELWLALHTPTFEAPENPRPLGVMLTDIRLRPLERRAPLAALVPVLGALALAAGLLLAGATRRDALPLAALAALGLTAAAVLYRPAALPLPWLQALILVGVAGAAIVAPQRAARLGLAALAVLVALSGLIWPAWLSDDAFISFRYAQNLAQGHGLVYNLGERVEGYTNFLWTLLAALVIRLGGDVALWSHAAGVALGLAIVLGTYGLGARLAGPACGLGAALVVATSQSLLLYSARGSGLETALFTLLLLAASICYLAAHRRRPGLLVAAGLLLGLAALTRPEGAMVFALTTAHLALVTLLARRAAQRPQETSWRALGSASGPLLTLSLAFLALFAPYFLWRVTYYGDLLPNTFYAKTGGGLSQVLRGLAYAGGFALTLGGPLLLAVLVPWVRSWRAALASWRGYLLPLVLAYSAYIVAVGGDHFRGERFFVPIIPWLAILLVDGILALADRPRTSVTAPSLTALAGPSRPSSFAYRGLPGLLLTVALALAALLRATPLNATVQGLDESVWIWREIGWWMADHAPPGASLAAAGAGAPAFYGQRETIDLYGLTDRHIGRLEVAAMGTGVAGHEKRDPDYVLNVRRVTYIPRIWDDYFGGAAALEGRYRLITVTTRTGRAIELWERLPVP
ncbi:MAG: hypothetical protein OHK0015_32250 [Chloroflexi bacterium OHK40]